MSKKQMVRPGTQRQGENIVTDPVNVFGIWRDGKTVSGDRVGTNGFTKLENADSYPHETIGRRGTYLHTTALLPTIATTITASKTGQTITTTVGTMLSSYVGDYFVWPDGDNDQIIGFTNATTITVRRSNTKASVAGCTIREPIFGNIFHEKTGKHVIQVGTRFFYSLWNIASYTQIYTTSYETPTMQKSRLLHFDDEHVVVVNGGKIFKINISKSHPYFYLMNSPVPQDRPADVDESDTLTVKSRYIYSMSKMTGEFYWGNRIGDPDDDNTTKLDIEQESGTNTYDEHKVDYAEVSTEKMVGLGNETYGLIISGVGASGHATGINKDIDLWRTLTSCGCSIDMNGRGAQDIYFDFSTVDTLDDVALIMQYAFRVYFASAWVKLWIDSNGVTRLLISTGKMNGTSFTAVAGDPVGPPSDITVTDVSGYDDTSGCGMLCTDAEGGVIADDDSDPTYRYTAPVTLSEFYVAPIPNSDPEIPQKHWTHYSLYRTRDIGKVGTDPISGIGNDPNIFVWCDDVPVAKAFRGVISAVGTVNIVTLGSGRFQQSDIGSYYWTSSGNSGEILYLCDAAAERVYTRTSLYAVFDGDVEAGTLSATLGDVDAVDATIITATKAAHIVTRTAGGTFSTADIGKPLFWSDGSITWIRAYTDANTVETIEYGAKISMCCVKDPVSRDITDTTTDEILFARLSDFFQAKHRLFAPLPYDVNRGTVLPGFLVVGKAGDSKYFYSQIKTARSYLTGYHFEADQYGDLSDNIQEIEDNPNALILRCTNSTYGLSTDTAINNVIGLGFDVGLLPKASILDTIGTANVKTIKKTSLSETIMLCQDRAVRIFNGSRYGDDLSDKQVDGILRLATTLAFSHYDPVTGFLIWFSTKEGS